MQTLGRAGKVARIGVGACAGVAAVFGRPGGHDVFAAGRDADVIGRCAGFGKPGGWQRADDFAGRQVHGHQPVHGGLPGGAVIRRNHQRQVAAIGAGRAFVVRPVLGGLRPGRAGGGLGEVKHGFGGVRVHVIQPPGAAAVVAGHVELAGISGVPDGIGFAQQPGQLPDFLQGFGVVQVPVALAVSHQIARAVGVERLLAAVGVTHESAAAAAFAGVCGAVDARAVGRVKRGLLQSLRPRGPRQRRNGIR